MVRRLATSVNQAVIRSSLLDDPTGVNRAAEIRAPQANLQVYEYTILAMRTKRLVSNSTHSGRRASQFEYRRLTTVPFIVVPSVAAVITARPCWRWGWSTLTLAVVFHVGADGEDTGEHGMAA